jgi:hypothetical protein
VERWRKALPMESPAACQLEAVTLLIEKRMGEVKP